MLEAVEALNGKLPDDRNNMSAHNVIAPTMVSEGKVAFHKTTIGSADGIVLEATTDVQLWPMPPQVMGATTAEADQCAQSRNWVLPPVVSNDIHAVHPATRDEIVASVDFIMQVTSTDAASAMAKADRLENE